MEGPANEQRPAQEPKSVPAPPPPDGALAPGARVRLSRGLLAGKEGTVTAETGKGYYKVRIGTLEVQVLGTELSWEPLPPPPPSARGVDPRGQARRKGGT